MWKQVLHSDDYRNSLKKELTVCDRTIQRIRKTLELLERKHHKTTELFIEEPLSGKLAAQPDSEDDYTTWKNTYDSLKRWEELQNQYREAFQKMKS